ncbi:regulatory protein GemA [Acidovorax sp. NCPPB 3576]|uniref:regulatory protein GemA n=1 Tax=Acidovorax sp. NCPPB 3576 TaxID=2940488 RepID=UPI00234B6031|nr:regulatory protein GemA [Acidovorax sp. NCPPB 3576]WCM88529.1 regulatory protein GemA [Acidovorax sp. NCPPB 3576]
MKANHIAAIHVLKAKLSQSDDDYRVLLQQLTGKTSSKAMSAAEQQRVRDHMQGLAERQGLVPATTRRRPLTREQFGQAKNAASPRERKVWALWHQLHRDGLVNDKSQAALDAWVHRQVGVSALRFATGPQLDTLIEALKAWVARGDGDA